MPVVKRTHLLLPILAGMMLAGMTPAASAANARPDTTTRLIDSDTVSTGDLFAAAKQAMMGDPEQALRHAQSAETLARRAQSSSDQKTDIATAFWLQAEALLRLNRANEAAPLIERAIILVGSRKTEDRLGGDLMLTRGRVSRNQGDIEDALKSFQEAHDILSALEVRRGQAIALQSIGSIYNDAHDYDRVVEYYERSAEAYSGDPVLDMSASNNIANAYKLIGEYDKALLEYEKALEMARGFESPMLIARIQTNIASVHVLLGDLSQAEAAVAAGLAVSNDADAAAWKPFLWGVQAQIDLARDNIDAAVENIEKLFEDTRLQETNISYLEFHEVAANIYQAAGQMDMALAHFKAYKRLNDVSLNAAASANVALMGAEFDFASQQLEIEKLKTGQLQRDIALANARDQQHLMFAGFIALFGLLIAAALGFGYVSIRRSRNSIRKANSDLQHSHARLQETNAALEKANNAKTEFLATTSHEIRTPLNGILGMTEVILKNNRLSREDRERVETVRKAGNSLLLIVNDILDVAKIESGRMKVVTGPVKIRDSISETIELWRENALNKGLRVKADISGLPDMIEADEKYIRQIIFNLLSNAIKFTDEGVIGINGWTQQTADGEIFMIQIRDSGIGIADHELENIFKTFQQVETGANRKYGGTGLGLSICRKLARLMEGELSVESEIGMGSTFTLSLPCRRLKALPMLATDKADQSAPVNLTELDVLVAEDNKVNQIVIDSLLRGCVRSVDIVEDGTEVLEALKIKQYDLILMDKQMPGMDGIAATKAIRSSGKSWQDIYIIAVTADAFDGAREQLLAEGMDDYLSKPVSQESLVSVMQQAIVNKLAREGAEGEEACTRLKSAMSA